jgi:hypothetical protein
MGEEGRERYIQDFGGGTWGRKVAGSSRHMILNNIAYLTTINYNLGRIEFYVWYSA